MDENTTVEFQVETTAEEASNGLERVVSILERMEASITGIASSLSNFKTNTDAVVKSFDKLKASSRKSFDTASLRKSTEMMERYRDLAKKMSKSDNVTHRADSKSMTAAIREAELHMRAMKDLDPGTDKFKKHEQALIRCKNELAGYRRIYQSFQAEQAAAARAAEAERAAAVEARMNNITYVDNTAPKPENEGSYVQQTIELGKGVSYDIEEITREIEEANGPAKELRERIEAIAKIKIKSPEDLAKAFEAQKRFDRAAQTNKDNIVKFTAVGDTKHAVKEAEKLAANEAAVKAFEAAINSADEAWKRLASGEEISITNPEEYLEAEKNLKKLNNEVHRYSAELRRAKAAGDAVGAGKAQLKLDGALAEQGRYTAALNNASQIRADMEAAEQLEDVYKRADKLRSQIAGKEVMGKNTFNSPALRKLKMDLTDAQIEAVKLKHSLGEISGGEAMAQNMGLVAKRTIQARIHMRLLDKESKKANRSFIQMGRVLQLMAVRMGVRHVLKDLRAGFVALAQGYEPFNEAVSKMMDSSTQIRNNLVSAFQPLINAIAPAAINALNGIANVVEKIAQAFAAMTGQSYYVKLTSEAQNFAKANEEAKNSLAGFDRFNLLGDDKKGSNGEDFKTSTELVEVPDEMKKWEHIGRGIRELFEGIGDVIESLIEKFREWFGLADDEDVFEFIGDSLTKVGDWLSEHSDGFADFLILLGKIKVALAGLSIGSKIFNFGKTALGFGKGVFDGGKKLWDGAKGLFGGGKAAKTVKDVATTTGTKPPPGSLAAGGYSLGAVTGLIATGILSALRLASSANGTSDKQDEQIKNGDFAGAAWTGIKGFFEAPFTIAKEIGDLSESFKEHGKQRTGDDVSGFTSLGIAIDDKLRDMLGAGRRDYNEDPTLETKMKGFMAEAMAYAQQRTGDEQGLASSLGILLKDKLYSMMNGGELPRYNTGAASQLSSQAYMNTSVPQLTSNFTNRPTDTANQSGIVTAVTTGVERAVTKAMTGKDNNVNVTVKVEGDLNKLFKFIVQQNNAQFNRSGRSPLKV